MLVRFWGTRGSLPVALNAAAVRGKIIQAVQTAVGMDLHTNEQIEAFVDHQLDFATAGTYGGNSSCVEIDDGGGAYTICDLGTGVRAFGDHFLHDPKPGRAKTFNVFLSHLHWDHVMGFPLFGPAFLPDHRIVIHGCHELLEQAIRAQFSIPSFPVPFEALRARVEFATLEAGEIHELGDRMTVRPMRQNHPGDSYGYRFEKHGKCVVYATDLELPDSGSVADATVGFFRGADLVVSMPCTP